ncbi:MAG: dUTP diphosphatase [Bacilli bacterium]|nr:dUTP diphosphatase [Bacilli bacterium]
MKVNIKKLSENAVIPQYAKPGDAGMDVVATSVNVTSDYIEYGTGLSFEVPEGYCMLIFPRSSNSKKDLLLANSVGVLDSGYRGELKLRFKRVLRPELCSADDTINYHSTNIWYPTNNARFNGSNQYEVGDKVGQIMIIPYPQIEFNEVEELSETDRGSGGFGSTGK